MYALENEKRQNNFARKSKKANDGVYEDPFAHALSEVLHNVFSGNSKGGICRKIRKLHLLLPFLTSQGHYVMNI